MKKLLVQNRRAVPVGEFKREGSNESFVSTATGEINAGSKVELLAAITTLAEAVSDGSVTKEIAAPAVASQEGLMTAAERQTILTESWGDKHKWATLGAAIGGELSRTATREGFMRRLLLKADVAQGSVPRIRVKEQNVIAAIASDVSSLAPQRIRDKYAMPPEFTIHANLRIENRELNQGTGDLLEEKFFEGNEAIMVQEDRLWKKMTDSLSGVSNAQQLLVGGLTPNNLSVMTDQVNRWNLPTTTLLVASDILSDFKGSNWSAALDPVSQYEILLTGVIGTLHGMNIITDAYRVPTQKVLDRGEVYVISSPEYHGAYTDRGPVESSPQDSYNDGAPAKGWYMHEDMSMFVANSRSVVRGVRA